MAYINTIKSANHGLINKLIKKEGIRPTCRPKNGRFGGGYAIPATKKHSPSLSNDKSICTCSCLRKVRFGKTLPF